MYDRVLPQFGRYVGMYVLCTEVTFLAENHMKLCCEPVVKFSFGRFGDTHSDAWRKPVTSAAELMICILLLLLLVYVWVSP